MSRKSALIKQSIILIVCRIIMLAAGFAVKRIIVMFVAKEFLGLNSLFSSLLGFLNLAELGLGTAISLRLYKPLVDNDHAKVNSILKLSRQIYLIIGILVFIMGLIMSTFVHVFIKDNPFTTDYTRIAFIISVFGTSLSYVLSDKRLYYVSNEKYWVTILFDAFFRIASLGIGVLILSLTHEYLFFILATEVYLFFSNICLNILFAKQNKDRKVLAEKEFTDGEKKEIKKSLKDLIPSKVGAFIFASIDSILISIMLGLTDTGVYGNYLLLFNSSFGLLSLVCNSMTGTFGKMSKETDNKEVLYNSFMKFFYIMSALSLVLSVGLFICCDAFVSIWMGSEEFILQNTIVLIFSLDLYFHIMAQPYISINMSYGDLKFDKIISIISLFMNLTISIVLGLFLGLHGIVLGTLISDFVNYLFRLIYVLKKDFLIKDKFEYFKPVLIFASLVAAGALCFVLKGVITKHVESNYLRFLILGFICVAVTAIPSFFLYQESKRGVKLKNVA